MSPESLEVPDAFEASLRSLKPSPGRIDRDLILYRAGQASMRPRRRPVFWPSVAAGLAAIALLEAGLLANRDAPGVVERIVVVREPIPTPPALPEKVAAIPPRAVIGPQTVPALTAHDRAVDLIVRYGLDGLPASPRSAFQTSGPASVEGFNPRSILEEESLETREPGDPS